MDVAPRRGSPDDEASAASRSGAAELLRAWGPFRFTGRLGRAAFALAVVAWHAAFAIGAGLTVTVVLLVVSVVWGSDATTPALLAAGALLAATYVAGLASYAVRRLNDLGRGAAWVVLGFVPVVNLVFAALLLVVPGDEGANAHGDAPKTPVLATAAAWSAAEEANRDAAFEAGRRFAERRASARDRPTVE